MSQRFFPFFLAWKQRDSISFEHQRRRPPLRAYLICPFDVTYDLLVNIMSYIVISDLKRPWPHWNALRDNSLSRTKSVVLVWGSYRPYNVRWRSLVITLQNYSKIRHVKVCITCVLSYCHSACFQKPLAKEGKTSYHNYKNRKYNSKNYPTCNYNRRLSSLLRSWQEKQSLPDCGTET